MLGARFLLYTCNHCYADTVLINALGIRILKYIQKNQVKSKNTKILNSEENSKRKIKNQKAKSKVQTHQTNG